RSACARSWPAPDDQQVRPTGGTGPGTPGRDRTTPAREDPGGRRCEGAFPRERPGQTRPVITACLTSAIALVTSMPRGHASVQLKVVRQRQTPSLEFRISSRCSPASSRESKMKRWALTIAAGPKYCPSVQNTGHEDVHAAQRMHLVVSS